MNDGAQLRLGVFGGTFDPPHLGHFEVASTVLRTGRLDRVLFIPCLVHAFGKAPVAFAHRRRMCELLIDDHPFMEVSDIETRLTTPGRTLELVDALSLQYPGARLHIVAGLDIYYERTRWFRFHEVERRAPPIYIRRAGQPDVPGLEVLPAPPGISSSSLRALLARRESTEGLLSAPVRAYIDQHNLYEVK